MRPLLTLRNTTPIGPLLAFLALALPPGATDAADPSDVYRYRLSTIGSERATQGPGNKIVTYDGKTHVVWQDATKDGYLNRVRTYDHATEKWSEVVTLNKGVDNHARPNITVDDDGYLHAIISGHNSPVTHRRSRRPNDATAWTPPSDIGSGTYPVVVVGPDDTVYTTMRSADRWEGMDLHVKPRDEKWRHRGLLVTKQDRFNYYAAYANALAWGPDHQTLHMSTGFFLGHKKRPGEHNREPQGLHQAVGYMRTDDFGKSWSGSAGQPIETPATTATIDLIDSGTRAHEAKDEPKPAIRHCGLAVDSDNRPYVLYIRHTPKPGRVFLVTPDGDDGWERRGLHEAVAKRWPEMVPIARRSDISRTRDDVLCVTLTVVPREHPDANWSPGIWGRPEFWLRKHPKIKRIVWLESSDGGRTFTQRRIVPHEPDRGTLLPTLEKPTGFNAIPAGRRPPLLYFEGLSRYRRKGEIIQNDVYYVEPR